MAVCDIGQGCSIVCQTGCSCYYDENGDCCCDCSDDEPGGKSRSEKEERWKKTNFTADSVTTICLQEVRLAEVHRLLSCISATPLSKLDDGRDPDEKITLVMKDVKFSEILTELKLS